MASVKDPNLRRFWFEFDLDEPVDGLSLGCGVTAYDEQDALSLITDTYFRETSLPPIARVISDVDASTLDADHVIPNMGTVIWRGIWWPRQPNQP